MKECKKITRKELLSIMKANSEIYDVVRMVEPSATEVVSISDHNIVKSQMDSCFSVWNKKERCENCISLRACMERKRMTKFEFKDNEVYSVVSMPFIITDAEFEKPIALELVNHVTNDVFFQTQGSGMIVEQVEKINKRSYEDSLTGVYNRRYYDENCYLYGGNDAKVPQKIAFLVADINRFKHINDIYDHAHGDEVLMAVAKTLREKVRDTDKVIRIGGDEFLIVLLNCEENFAKRKAKQLMKAMDEIQFDWLNGFKLGLSIGVSYTNEFCGSKDNLRQLFDEADQKMYENKNAITDDIKHMLIVDDLKLSRTVLNVFFEKEYIIYEAADGVEALDILKQHPIEIVITDIYMPNMDGLELTKAIRKIPELSEVIIVVITDRGESYELEALSAGADDFVNKPFNPELLHHRINGVLSQKAVCKR